MAFKVLIAVDGSENSDYAVRSYFNDMHRENNEVIFVQVSESLVHGSVALRPGLGVRLSDWEKLVNESKEKMAAVENRYLPYAAKKGVEDSKFIHAEGKPGPKVVELSNEHNVNMIVIGTRGQGALKRRILGSVSDYVVHHSDKPVVVCCEPPSERRARSDSKSGEPPSEGRARSDSKSGGKSK